MVSGQQGAPYGVLSKRGEAGACEVYLADDPSRRRFPAAGIAAAVVLAVGLVTGGCRPEPDRQAQAGVTELEAALDRARSASAELGRRLMTALGEQLASGAPATAIGVCSEIAPAAANELSRDGLAIRRTSLRYRNPGNAPDPWERAWLERLEARLAAGEPLQEVHEIDAARGELRYLGPILVGPGCLRCHGAEDELDSDVREQLARHYPDDRATGFAAGDLRGAFSVRVAMDSPASD